MAKRDGVGMGVFVIALKLGPKLMKLGTTLLKGGKLVKGGLFVGSAASYTVLFSWKIAAMILILLAFHEGGHLWAMKKRGMKTKGMYFIPFLGAAAVAEDEFPSREAENYVALMGPTVGLVISVLAYVGYLLTGDLEFVAAAGWMALINLFNLIPVMPLDGGRVLRSISFSFGSWKGIILTGIGMAAGLAAMVVMNIWLFVILIPIGMLETLSDFRTERKKRQRLEDLRGLLSNKEMELFSSGREYIEGEIEKIRLFPRMSRNQMARGIIWTLVLAASLAFLLYSVTSLLGDETMIDILR